MKWLFLENTEGAVSRRISTISFMTEIFFCGQIEFSQHFSEIAYKHNLEIIEFV
jgi:hypothetical protein